MTSERTKKMRRLKTTFWALDFASYILTTCVMVAFALSRLGGKSGGGGASTEVLSAAFVNTVTSMSVTAVIGIVASIFIKDKMRTTLFIADVIMASIIFGSKGMYVILTIWFVDEYVFHALYAKFKAVETINREIDLRG